ncbi:MAG: amino acid transporter [Chloroflexota bacterium]|nr:amino acid transporter [Chloroflexota bacterium]
MPKSHVTPPADHGLAHWLLEGQPDKVPGPHHPERTHAQQPWWRVMCLTGVDYFSTLGYQPGIAALAAGTLAPIATVILVLITLFGALPMYFRVAEESPRGEGSIAMLERLLSWWKGKLFVLCLLGFVATDFIITITLSAADASAHALENPFFPQALSGQRVAVTLLLVTLLGAIFLKGFSEAIGIAVVLVGAYLLLNLVVIGASMWHLVQQPRLIGDWQRLLFTQQGSVPHMIAVALLLFPRLALGLSGFETGVAVMPLVRGDEGDTPEQPAGRIRNTHKLLFTAAIMMSCFLITSSLATITLIPAEEFQPGGKANGRALAYLAHEYLGAWFGTAYDVSTILILWFAGASAMAGLLNIVPRYLPRYGMAPDWTGATRPLVLIFTVIAFGVTLIFNADVDAQGGAYATGVLVLMSSAAVAVMLAVWQRHQRNAAVYFALIVLVFAYTTVVNVIERPDGIKIGGFFIAMIILTSVVSRVWRTTELRVGEIVLDPEAERFVEEASRGTLHIIPNGPDRWKPNEYAPIVQRHRAANCVAADHQVLILEIIISDPSEFAPALRVYGEEVNGQRVLRATSASIANAIAAFLLYLRDRTGTIPHAYFAWTEGRPLPEMVQYVLLGRGDLAPITHEILRHAERDRARRPVIHVS